MREQLQKELSNIDKTFFRQAYLYAEGQISERDTCMGFGCCCGDGWYKPLRTFVQKVKILNELGERYNIRFVAKQIKQKYGTLRIYANSQKINIQKQFIEGYQVLQKMFEDILYKCECQSRELCEWCGNYGGTEGKQLIGTRGWINYICKDCARELTQKQTKIYDKNNKGNQFYGQSRITLFKYQNKFLDICDEHPFKYGERYYNNILHCYYSFKDKQNSVIYDDIKDGRIIQKIAKKNGIILDDLSLLKSIVYKKFVQNSDIRKELYLTGDKLLIYMNKYHQNELGHCYCENCQQKQKKNNYGKILMEVREELLKDIEQVFYKYEQAKKFVIKMGKGLKLYEYRHKELEHLKKYIVSNKQAKQIEEFEYKQLEIRDGIDIK